MWNIITTEPRREVSVTGNLIGRGVEVYLPTLQVRVRAPPRVSQPFIFVDRPLFPSYIFAKLDSDRAWKAVHEISGLVGYLKGKDGPKSISDAAIAAVKDTEKHIQDMIMTDKTAWKPGDKVEIQGDEWSIWENFKFVIGSLDKSDRAILFLMSNKSVKLKVPTAKLKAAS